MLSLSPDAFADIIAVGNQPDAKYILNYDGADGFTYKAFGSDQPVASSSVACGDMDSDGDLDVISEYRRCAPPPCLRSPLLPFHCRAAEPST